MNRVILAATVVISILALAGCATAGPEVTATPRLLPTSEATSTLYLVARSTVTGVAPTPATVTGSATASLVGTMTPTVTLTQSAPRTATAPTPIPLPTGTLERTSNIGPYLLAPPEGGQPTHNLLVDGHMRGYLAINPAHWGNGDALPNMEGYGRNYMAEEEELSFLRRREQGARGYYDRFRPTYEQMRGKIHAWMSTWAFVYGDQEFADDWVAFQTEWLRLMHADGYLAGVGGMKTYPFRAGEFAWLAPAIAQADYLFLAESGAPTLTAGMGTTTLIYRDLVAELAGVLPGQKLPPLILDVCVDGKVLADLNAPGGPHWQRGYRDYGTTPEAYAADLRNYDIATLYDPYVRHVFWFATNITEETKSFDVNTPMLEIADGWYVAPGAE
jgi:hypothetical protein